MSVFLNTFRNLIKIRTSNNNVLSCNKINFSSVEASINKIIPIKTKTIAGESQIVEVKKKNLKQSPMKIGFLVKLINRSWVPDALAQLLFSPKHRAVDIAKLVKVIIIIITFVTVEIYIYFTFTIASIRLQLLGLIFINHILITTTIVIIR